MRLGTDPIEITINWDCECQFYNEIDIRTDHYGDFTADCEQCDKTFRGNVYER